MTTVSRKNGYLNSGLGNNQREDESVDWNLWLNVYIVIVGTAPDFSVTLYILSYGPTPFGLWHRIMWPFNLWLCIYLMPKVAFGKLVRLKCSDVAQAESSRTWLQIDFENCLEKMTSCEKTLFHCSISDAVDHHWAFLFKSLVKWALRCLDIVLPSSNGILLTLANVADKTQVKWDTVGHCNLSSRPPWSS